MDYRIVLVSLYRSPQHDVKKFVDTLELLISKVWNKKKYLVRFGDCNITYYNITVIYYLLQYNSHQQALISWILSNNLLNTVVSPMRIIKNTSSLTDVMITNKIFCNTIMEILEFGYSDHFVQVWNVGADKPKVGHKSIIKKCSKKGK